MFFSTGFKGQNVVIIVIVFSTLGRAGYKESQFYSLPFGQAVASMC